MDLRCWSSSPFWFCSGFSRPRYSCQAGETSSKWGRERIQWWNNCNMNIMEHQKGCRKSSMLSISLYSAAQCQQVATWRGSMVSVGSATPAILMSILLFVLPQVKTQIQTQPQIWKRIQLQSFYTSLHLPHSFFAILFRNECFLLQDYNFWPFASWTR